MIGIPRYCSWEVEECERYDTETRPEIREVTLKFKRMARLRDGETETYELVSSQVRTGKDEAAYRLKAVDTKRPVKIVARDGLFTLFEDVISVRGKKKN